MDPKLCSWDWKNSWLTDLPQVWKVYEDELWKPGPTEPTRWFALGNCRPSFSTTLREAPLPPFTCQGPSFTSSSGRRGRSFWLFFPDLKCQVRPDTVPCASFEMYPNMVNLKRMKSLLWRHGVPLFRHPLWHPIHKYWHTYINKTKSF